MAGSGSPKYVEGLQGLQHSQMAADVHHFHNGALMPENREAGTFFPAVGGAEWGKMLGSTLQTADGSKSTADVLKGKSKVALLFAGSWCPWCRAFDPLLADTVTKVQASDPDDTAVVYISADADEQAMQSFVAGKPWSTVPYNLAQGVGQVPIGYIRKKIREEQGKPQGTLGEKFGVPSLPFLVVLDGKSGDILNNKFIKDNGESPADGHSFSDKAPASWLDVAGSSVWYDTWLGSTLQTTEGPKATGAVLGGKKQVALLIAAEWCPWCRAFFPVLDETLKKVNAADPNDTALVYISSDENAEMMGKVTARLPCSWIDYDLAQGNGHSPLGYVRNKIREETGKMQGFLAEKFKAVGLPTLVVLDGQTGAVVAREFVVDLGSSPAEGHGFSAKAPASWLKVIDKVAGVRWDKMFGPTLQMSGGPKATLEVLKGKKNVALLFGGKWCPWCQAFDPFLADTIQKVNAADPNDTAVVYLSADADAQAMEEFIKDRPWGSVPYDLAQGNGQAPIGYVRKKVMEEQGKPQGILGTKYKVSALPTLIVLDGQTGDVSHTGFVEELGETPGDGHGWNSKAPASWLSAVNAVGN